MTQNDWFAVFTRIGFAARGLLYLATGFLLIGAGRAEGAEGALKFIGDGAGQWLLLLMAGGFAAYGLWRLSDAALGTEHPGDGRKVAAQRAGAGVSGVIHLFLAYQTVQLYLGAASASGSSDQTAREVLQLPAGQLILGGVGAGLIIAGIVQFVIAAKCSFLQNLDPQIRDTWVKWLGRAGYSARGAVFLFSGYFVAAAAIQSQSSEIAGVEQILEWLSRPVAIVMASGLFLFGIYALIEARYRRISTPDLGEVAGRVRDGMPV